MSDRSKGGFEFELILDGRWAVIHTEEDGWEIESQHCQSTFPLGSKDKESAIKEGRETALKIEQRFEKGQS